MPEYIWNNIFTVINTLICGLIVAFFTSTFLKKKEERTRIAGVIVEKRLNSEQKLQHYLEKELLKEEINVENSSIADQVVSNMLKEYDLPVPYENATQYAVVFKDFERFKKFFNEYDRMLLENKLWLDTKVKTQLVFMQLYFGFFNTIPLMIKRIPLPEENKLSDDEFDDLTNKVLFLLGISFDGEINGLLSDLDEKIVNSIYKLDLDRPRKSVIRNNMYNVDLNKLMKKLQKKTLLGLSTENIFALITDLVYKTKNIDLDELSEEEYDEFIKSSMPFDYDDMKEEFRQFKETVEHIAEETGVKIVNKKDLDNYPGMYGISIRDAIEGKNIKRTEELKVDEKKKESKE